MARKLINMSEQRILLSPRFSEAFQLAADLHATKLRKGTTIPYIAHLLGVTSIVFHYGASEDEGIAALLHDAIEDAPRDRPEGVERDAAWVRQRIASRFGEPVLAIVEGCTDADVSPKPPWHQRKETYVERVRTESASVVLVSAADKLHNASAILSDYRDLQRELWRRFNPEAGMEGTIGYYRGLVTAYIATGHHPRLVRALDAVVSQLEKEVGYEGVWPVPKAQKP
jgi:(p)ppGpp synthase/HD superfamily hydrolase